MPRWVLLYKCKNFEVYGKLGKGMQLKAISILTRSFRYLNDRDQGVEILIASFASPWKVITYDEKRRLYIIENCWNDRHGRLICREVARYREERAPLWLRVEFNYITLLLLAESVRKIARRGIQ